MKKLLLSSCLIWSYVSCTCLSELDAITLPKEIEDERIACHMRSIKNDDQYNSWLRFGCSGVALLSGLAGCIALYKEFHFRFTSEDAYVKIKDLERIIGSSIHRSLEIEKRKARGIITFLLEACTYPLLYSCCSAIYNHIFADKTIYAYIQKHTRLEHMEKTLESMKGTIDRLRSNNWAVSHVQALGYIRDLMMLYNMLIDQVEPVIAYIQVRSATLTGILQADTGDTITTLFLRTYFQEAHGHIMKLIQDFQDEQEHTVWAKQICVLYDHVVQARKEVMRVINNFDLQEQQAAIHAD